MIDSVHFVSAEEKNNVDNIRDDNLVKQQRTLLIVDSLAFEDRLTDFLASDVFVSHAVDVHEAKDRKIKLNVFGVYQYQNILLFAPNAKSFAAFSNADLHHFVQQGGNLILASSTKLKKTQRAFAEECGVTFHSNAAPVMDHFNFVKDDHLRSKIYVNGGHATDIPTMRMDKKTRALPILFEGLGQSFDKDNVLAFNVLSASSTAYSGSLTKLYEDKPEGMGTDISLVTAVQGRNNARMLFVGSIEMFTNEHIKNVKLGNKKFVDQISSWTFGSRGVLRASNIRHHREDGSQPEKMLKDIERPDAPLTLYPDSEVARESLVYRIKDNLTYAFDLDELKGKTWVPFLVDDMQVEFVMLDAYVRKTMSHDGKGRFSVTFEAPDQYGVFQFRVMYQRRGYSTVHLTNKVALRPYKHDEYERFIVAAYPYYASGFSMMVGIFLMSILFLYTK